MLLRSPTIPHASMSRAMRIISKGSDSSARAALCSASVSFGVRVCGASAARSAADWRCSSASKTRPRSRLMMRSSQPSSSEACFTNELR